MARSDLLLNLVRAGSRGDKVLLRQTVEALVAEERAKNHHALAERLAEYLNLATTNGSANGNGASPGHLALDERAANLVTEILPKRHLDWMILSDTVRRACAELIEEQHRVELLRSHGLEPRNRILLVGPPGNGKTSLAEAIAHGLMASLFVVRYDAVIGSYLGETANRLRRVFDFVGTRRCVLFFDEFDTLGKERGDKHDAGEIKRVVSSLLMQIDSLLPHVVVIAATNHPELLDRAVWRRFQVRLPIDRPTRRQVREWVERFQESLSDPLGVPIATLTKKLAGLSFAELEDFCTDVKRRQVLTLPNSNLPAIVRSALEQLAVRVR